MGQLRGRDAARYPDHLMRMSPGLLLHRLRALRRRHDVESAMDAEMRDHIECETAARIAAGMSPEDARRCALRDFGGMDRYKEEARDQRGFRALEELIQDAGYALRVLRRNPAYTTAAVLTFALGIGLTTAIFSVVHGVLLRPLPYPHADRLAVLWEQNRARSAEQNVALVSNFEAWRDRNRSFTGLAALVPSPITISGVNPERVMGAEASPGYFHLLGVMPAVGRDFTNDDAANVVVLSDGLWRRRFGADRAIVGSAITLNDKPFSVVGIMPPGFDPPRFGWLPEHELWLPFIPTQGNRGWGRFLLVMGRLRPDVTLDAARADLVAIAERLAQENEEDRGWSAFVVPLAQQITGDVRRPLLVLLGAVCLLLAMAATNVGALTLGMMRRREHELAVRRAIGAGRGRIVRQLLTQSLVLGAIGSAVGLAAAIGGARLLLALLPKEVPRAASIRIDGAVLSFAIAVALVATVAFGLFAALRSASRSDPRIGAPAPARRARGVGSGSLVVAEIALGIVLTVLAGLMVRSFLKLRSVDLGFDASTVVSARVSLPGVAYGTAERQRLFFDGLTERMRAMPGVRAASAATTRPFACCAPVTGVWRAAETPPPGVEPPTTDIRYVDSSFFAALRILMVAGSGFSVREPVSGTPRVVVNQTLARALWPGTNAVGRQLSLDLGDWQTHAPIRESEVIGVVSDVHLTDARTPPRAAVYLATARFPSSDRDIIVRGDVAPGVLIDALRGALHSLDPALPLYQVTTMDEAVDQSLARDRFTTMILSAFALVSLLLAAVGVYGVFAAEVTARRKELGLRLALGARPGDVVMLVVRRALVLASLGAAVGVAGGLLASRSLTTLVYDVATSDTASYVGVTVVLIGVGLLATLLPAVRAARISPLESIRSD